VSAVVDPTQLRFALDELINNAIRHNPPETPVLLSVSSVDGEFSIAVADRGSGIAPEAQPRIFDRFIRLRRTHKDGSLGLGLALVKAIAEAHGGRLILDSVPGAGTTFTLCLPAEEGGSAPETGDGEDAIVSGERPIDWDPDCAAQMRRGPGAC
jgi:two-component system sensor histidine kinase SenX3